MSASHSRLSLCLSLALLAALTAAAPLAAEGRPGYVDSPGITPDEVAAIERVKAGRGRLVLGNERSAEFFPAVDGGYGGAIVLLCEWLTDFFGIPVEWEDREFVRILSGLED
ncbi:MAG: hypothetical protein LBG06_07290, partial [Deltaproteobacteria bacterium]|nr:hypothetical protein [Deltaproteobacteria bacterium]